MDDFGKVTSKMLSKSYICDICKKNFISKSYLSVPKKVHSKDKPYKCEDCVKRFINKSVLKRHMLVHSGKNDF